MGIVLNFKAPRILNLIEPSGRSKAGPVYMRSVDGLKTKDSFMQ